MPNYRLKYEVCVYDPEEGSCEDTIVVTTSPPPSPLPARQEVTAGRSLSSATAAASKISSFKGWGVPKRTTRKSSRDARAETRARALALLQQRRNRVKGKKGMGEGAGGRGNDNDNAEPSSPSSSFSAVAPQSRPATSDFEPPFEQEEWEKKRDEGKDGNAGGGGEEAVDSRARGMRWRLLSRMASLASLPELW